MPGYTAISPKDNNDPITTTDWGALADDLALHQTVTTVRPTNNTGGTVTRGYVGVLDPAASLSLIASSIAADTRMPVVVQDTSVVTTGLVYCQTAGHVAAINVTGAVGLYELLETSGTPGYARQGASAPFAIALEAFAGPGTGQIQALLMPAMAGGSFPTGLPSATHGPWPFHLTTTAPTTLVAAPSAGLTIFVTEVRVMQNNTTATLFTVKDGTGPTIAENYPIAGVVGHGVDDDMDPPWAVGDAESLVVVQSAAGDLYGSVNGYVAATPS